MTTKKPEATHVAAFTHPDRDLLIEAARTRGPATVETFDWQPGDATSYRFTVAHVTTDNVVGVAYEPAPAEILVACTNLGIFAQGTADWWAACTLDYLAAQPGMHGSRRYNVAAFLRFVWAHLGVHASGVYREELERAGVIR